MFVVLAVYVAAAVGVGIVYYGIKLYRNFKWWVDLLFALVGIAWTILYITTALLPVRSITSYPHGAEILRTIIIVTLLAMLLNLVDRYRDCR